MTKFSVKHMIGAWALSSIIFCASSAFGEDSAKAIRVVGSSTVENVFLKPNITKIKNATGVEMELRCKGSGAGIVELAKGNADVAGISETLDEAFEAAKKLTAESQWPMLAEARKKAVYTELGKDRIVVIVNEKNKNVKELTDEQLKGIFGRRITNWKELGGDDQPIVIVVSPPGSATAALFYKTILGGKEPMPAVTPEEKARTITAYSTASELGAVQHAPNVIAVVSHSVTAGASLVREVRTTSIERSLGVITIGAPSGDTMKVVYGLKNLKM